MSAGDSLNPEQFRHEYSIRQVGKDHFVHDVTAHVHDGPVGVISWDHHTGEVGHVAVLPEFRRQGVASGMWAAARAYSDLSPSITEPKHSPIRSHEGDAWVKSVSPKRSIPEAERP